MQNIIFLLVGFVEAEARGKCFTCNALVNQEKNIFRVNMGVRSVTRCLDSLGLIMNFSLILVMAQRVSLVGLVQIMSNFSSKKYIFPN